MSSAKKPSRLKWLYVASLVVHAVAGIGLAVIPKKQIDEIVSVVLSDIAPQQEEARPPEPPPPPPAAASPAAAVAPQRRQARAPRANPMPPSDSQMRQAAAAAANAQTAGTGQSGQGEPGGGEYGIMLGSDGAAGEGGIAVPLGPGGGGGALAEARPRVVSVTRALAPPPRRAVVRGPRRDGCDDPEISRPRPISVPRPSYPDSARTAGVAVKVRVRLTVDDQGRVVSAEVLSGPDSGLHAAALTAARNARFEPSMRCGRAVSGTFTLGVRFAI